MNDIDRHNMNVVYTLRPRDQRTCDMCECSTTVLHWAVPRCLCKYVLLLREIVTDN